jgi:chromate transporter
VGAPFIEMVRDNKNLNGALSAITAAVVGVILNLAVWFALHTVFAQVTPVRRYGLAFDMPVLSSVDPWALGLSLAAAVAILRFKVGMIAALIACTGAGIVLHLVGLIS